MTTKKKSMSPFAKELMQSMEEGLAYLKGEGPATVTKLSLPDPPPRLTQRQIHEIRRRCEMTQMQFARLLNVSTKTVEGWEQGVRVPSGAALRMLQVIDDPSVLGVFAPLPENSMERVVKRSGSQSRAAARRAARKP